MFVDRLVTASARSTYEGAMAAGTCTALNPMASCEKRRSNAPQPQSRPSRIDPQPRGHGSPPHRQGSTPMLTPKVERLPPVTIEFLRVVGGVETVRLHCDGCKAVQVASWADLGLPDASPFPPTWKTWKCSKCGETDVVATPEWPVEAKRATVTLPESTIPTEPQYTLSDGMGAITPDLRDHLESMLARLGPLET